MKEYLIECRGKSETLFSVTAIFSLRFITRRFGGIPATLRSLFYSGTGSNQPALVEPYISAVRNHFLEIPTKLTAVDMGCGDFRVGSRLVDLFSSFVACDVVDELIEFNKTFYAHLPVDFRKVDLVSDSIPAGEVLIVRQVLQHLSNEQITKFLRNIPKSFKLLLVTEHLPNSRDFTPNMSKNTGPEIRLTTGSGVVLTDPPFNLKAKSQIVLVSIPKPDSRIDTLLYEL